MEVGGEGPRKRILEAQGSHFWNHLNGMKPGLWSIRRQAVGVNKALELGLSLGRVLLFSYCFLKWELNALPGSSLDI